LFYNKGFKSINRFLAGFLFFSSLYVLESFTFFFSESKNWVAFFTNTHSFFYLIGPSAFFYVRSMLRDNSHLDKKDWIHFLPFIIFFIGYIPYLFTNWDYKLLVADNIQSESWDMAKFHLNVIIPHKMDQALNVLQIYFYSASLWYFIWKYKRNSSSRIYNVPQFKLIRNWLFIFTLLITIIALNFTVAMANMWIYDDKSIFLHKASGALLFASIVYVGMNMIVMFFPHIMYGLPIEEKETISPFISDDLPNTDQIDLEEEKAEIPLDLPQMEVSVKKELPQLFSESYIQIIDLIILKVVNEELYLQPDFKLNKIAETSDLPAHHLTYYFNSILNLSFSNWRNNLRIAYAIKLMNEGESSNLTLEAIALKSGFVAQNTFNRAFKLQTNETPTEYLKRISEK
jgi:AraC-like DNA-binding protein